MVTIDGIKIADIGFYINLDHRQDRNEQILRNLDDFSIKGVERISGRFDTPDTVYNLLRTNLDIYEIFLDSDAETVLILEDDCKFLNILREHKEELFNNNVHGISQWDIYWLGNQNRRAPKHYYANSYQVSSVSYSQSYLIRKNIIKDILKFMDETPISMGIDEFLCLFPYGYDMVKDPFSAGFYDSKQPLDEYPTNYLALTYGRSVTTQYNSYSDNMDSQMNLEDWLPRSEAISFFK